MNRIEYRILRLFLQQNGSRPSFWLLFSTFFLIPGISFLYGSAGFVVGFLLAVLPSIAWDELWNSRLYSAVTPKAIRAKKGKDYELSLLDAKLLSENVEPRRYRAGWKESVLIHSTAPAYFTASQIAQVYHAVKNLQVANEQESEIIERYYTPGPFPFLTMVRGAIPMIRAEKEYRMNELMKWKSRWLTEKRIRREEYSFDSKIESLNEIEHMLSTEPSRIRSDFWEGRISEREAERQQAQMLRRCNAMWQSVIFTPSLVGMIRFALAGIRRMWP